MSRFQVISDKCTKCQICVRDCPAVIISMDKTTGLPVVPESAAGTCIRCSHCVMVCPSDACTLDYFPENEYRTVDLKKLPTKEQYETLMATRRSVRQFKKKGIPQENIEKILAIANLAPTASNSQQVYWVITVSPETTQTVREKCKEYLMNRLAETPDDAFALRHLGRINMGSDSIFRTAPHVAIAMVPKTHIWVEDGTIALTHFDNACHAMGFGACWGGLFKVILTKDSSLRAYLGIGDDMQICGTLLFGEKVLKTCAKLPLRDPVKIRFL